MKESIVHIDNRVWRETFNSTAEVTSNGGVLTGVTITDGLAKFDTGKAVYTKRMRTSGGISYSFKIDDGLNLEFSGGYLLSHGDAASSSLSFYRSGTNFFVIATSSVGNYKGRTFTYSAAHGCNHLTIVIGAGLASFAMYADGVLVSSTDFSFGAGVDIEETALQIGAKADGTAVLENDLDMIEIRDWAITAEEASALANNNLFIEPDMNYLLLDIDPRLGTIYDRFGATLTNTDAVVAIEGGLYTGLYNGTTAFVQSTDSYEEIAYSLSCWCKFTEATLQSAMSLGTVGGGDRATLGTGVQNPIGTDNALTFGVWASAAWQAIGSGVVPTLGRWYHLVGTSEGTTGKLYINGVLDDTGTGEAMSGPRGINSGARHDAANRNFFKGNVGRVKFYKKALSLEEVVRDYNSQKRYYIG